MTKKPDHDPLAVWNDFDPDKSNALTYDPDVEKILRSYKFWNHMTAMQGLGIVFNEVNYTDERLAERVGLAPERIKELREDYSSVFSSIQHRANCYAFAMNDMNNKSGDKPSPGEATGFPLSERSFTSIDEMIARSVSDGVKPVGYDVPVKRTDGTYLVALYINHEEGYHWIRENPEHKGHELQDKWGHFEAKPFKDQSGQPAMVENWPVSMEFDGMHYMRVAFFEVPDGGVNVGQDADKGYCPLIDPPKPKF